jgi:tetratricopeptide (TPR) repeat protein
MNLRLMSPTLATTAALLICFAAHLRAEETADSYYHRGNANYQRGNFSAAIADYTRAIEANPKYNKAYYERGVARDAEGDRDGAIADYTRAIELDPKYADAYSQRVGVWEKMKQYNSAIKDIQKAIELEPKKRVEKGQRHNSHGGDQTGEQEHGPKRENNSSASYHLRAMQALARFGEQKDTSIWGKKGIFTLRT